MLVGGRSLDVAGRRILFVGNLQDICDIDSGVEKYLGTDWEAGSAATGEEAIGLLEGNSFDIITAGSSLSDMDCGRFFQKVRELQPNSIRFMVSTKEDSSDMVRSIGEVHRFIGYPVDREVLWNQIRSSLHLQQTLLSDELRARIAAVRSLPSLPEVHGKIMSELKSDNAPIAKVAALISQDVGITARLLQIVNSAYFGLNNRVEGVQQAILLLGLETVQSLVVSAGVFNEFQSLSVPGFSVDSMYTNSISVGAKAKLIAHAFGLGRRPTEDAFMGGMLHDVGKLLMLSSFQEELVEALRISKEQSLPLYQAEEKVLGVTDAAMGAYLLSLWGFPDSIVETVAWHYAPGECSGPNLNALTAVHVAFAIECDESNNVKDEKLSAIDSDYLTTLGIAEQIPSLRGFAAGATV